MMDTFTIAIFGAVLLLAHVFGAVAIALRQRGNPCRSARRGYASRLLRALDFDPAAARTGGAVAPRFPTTSDRKEAQ